METAALSLSHQCTGYGSKWCGGGRRENENKNGGLTEKKNLLPSVIGRVKQECPVQGAWGGPRQQRQALSYVDALWVEARGQGVL